MILDYGGKDPKRANIEQRYDHALERAKTSSHGIRPAFAKLVNTLATAGNAPGAILRQVQRLHQADPILNKLFPSVQQVHNRKATLGRKFADLWNMSLLSHVKEWVADKTCNTEREFYFGTEPTDDESIEQAFNDMTANQLKAL